MWEIIQYLEALSMQAVCACMSVFLVPSRTYTISRCKEMQQGELVPVVNSVTLHLTTCEFEGRMCLDHELCQLITVLVQNVII